jgi:hypothetical protein
MLLTRYNWTNWTPHGLVQRGVVPLVVHDVQGTVEQGPDGSYEIVTNFYNPWIIFYNFNKLAKRNTGS